MIPHVTETYVCSNDGDVGLSTASYPFCILKSFPFNVETAVQWAAAKIENLTVNKPEAFNAYWTAEDVKDIQAQLRAGSKLVFEDTIESQVLSSRHVVILLHR